MAVFVFVLLLVWLQLPSSSANFSVWFHTNYSPVTIAFEFNSDIIDDNARILNRAKEKFHVTNYFVKNVSVNAYRLITDFNPLFNEEEESAENNLSITGNMPSLTIPENFSSSEKWTECAELMLKVPGFRTMNCSLGWVLAFVKTLSDRMCIFTHGVIQAELSPVDILRCCINCARPPNLQRPGLPIGKVVDVRETTEERKSSTINPFVELISNVFNQRNSSRIDKRSDNFTKTNTTMQPFVELIHQIFNRNTSSQAEDDTFKLLVAPYCWGGDALAAWQHWIQNGIVSGGYTTETANQGCLPMGGLFEDAVNACTECHHLDQTFRNLTEIKILEIERQTFRISGAKVYVVPTDENQIQTQIMQHGPVQAGIDVYEDFFVYKDGVYTHVYGDLVGYHSVVIVGWGVENNVKYWDVVNVWGKGFGNEGKMKILRGVNECSIESYVIGGIMGNSQKENNTGIPQKARYKIPKFKKKKINKLRERYLKIFENAPAAEKNHSSATIYIKKIVPLLMIIAIFVQYFV